MNRQDQKYKKGEEEPAAAAVESNDEPLEQTAGR